MLAPLFVTTALLYIGYTCYSLHTLLCKVRPLGIPYFVVPFYPSPFIRVFIFPFMKLLIKVLGLTHPRFFLMTLDWQVRQRYEIYRFIGSDIFFTVTPWQIILHVADPDMAVEVLAGKDENGELYPKSERVSQVMGLFGENVLTVEGAAWRGHRKIAGPVIGKSSLSIVWEESLTQIQQMIQYYDKHEATNTSYRDFRRAALGVIAHAGFSKVMEWVPLTTPIANEKDREGSYQKHLHVLFENFMWAAIAPSWILEMLPFKALREAGGAANGFRFFMNEWFEEKKAKIELDNKTALNPSREDLMESLVRSSGLDKGSTLETPLLSKSEVIGNAFIFILAGHETTAHTIANAIYFLAMYPEYQVKLQEEIDSILGDSDHSLTSYEAHFDAFSSGWIAAIMFETLRLIPAAVITTRHMGPTTRTFPRTGSQRPVTLPPGIEFWIQIIGLSHNPKYWTQPGKTEAESAISEFRPERWLPKSGDNVMFKPYNGSYVPFSIGTRGCIGKKFAHVEFTAIMLGLFREMSVGFDSRGGRKTFEEARLECLAEMEKFESKITLQPTGEMPGIKWVRRRR
ncbi:cytochrome P450 [Tuber borchii]|uniref:Cytochrome P450 n=1 Tax=Tuber borchii TaxID=42251 RepID=A0A2T6ZQB6_TUBBO|nr:cytochrome P450 [Tuber borchii]